MNQDMQVFMVQQEQGWRIVLRNEDGAESISDLAYPTREDCEAAFLAWAEENHIERTKVH